MVKWALPWLEAFTTWLGGSPLNALIVGTPWIVPAVQVVHILAVAATLAAVAIVNLRVFGWVERDQRLSLVVDRFSPTLAITLPILAATGLILICAEPNRAMYRTAFWLKMAMILAAGGLAANLARSTRAGAHERGGAAVIALRAQSAVSMALWLGVVVAGRWIGYATGWPGSPQ